MRSLRCSIETQSDDWIGWRKLKSIFFWLVSKLEVWAELQLLPCPGNKHLSSGRKPNCTHSLGRHEDLTVNKFFALFVFLSIEITAESTKTLTVSTGSVQSG